MNAAADVGMHHAKNRKLTLSLDHLSIQCKSNGVKIATVCEAGRVATAVVSYPVMIL